MRRAQEDSRRVRPRRGHIALCLVKEALVPAGTRGPSPPIEPSRQPLSIPGSSVATSGIRLGEAVVVEHLASPYCSRKPADRLRGERLAGPPSRSAAEVRGVAGRRVARHIERMRWSEVVKTFGLVAGRGEVELLCGSKPPSRW